MRSKREASQKTLHFKMMVFVLTLAFSRETAGATFFHQYGKNGTYSLSCSQSATKYVWYRGRGSPPSLQEFEVIVGDRSNSLTSPCAVDPPPHYTNKTLHTSDGGVFACAPRIMNGTCPLFSDGSHCSSFDFFIIAVRDPTDEKAAFGGISEQSVLAVTEKDPFNLTCKLPIENNSTGVTLYWFKETTPSICLFSASNEGDLGGKFSHDFNCCVDPAIKQRRTDDSLHFKEKWLHQHLTIDNASYSDSGTYLCVVAIRSRKQVWTIACNVSVEVVNSTLSPASPTDDGTVESTTNGLPISLGVTGGVILIGGITGLLYWKKKAKGNPVEEHPRNRTEMEMAEDDCSPYAVSSRKDVDWDDTTYSVVTPPPGIAQGTSALSDGNPVCQSGKNVHTVYALLSK